MTRRIVLRPAARQDLAEIVEHSVPTWGAAKTADYLAAIRTAIATVADNPSLGSNRDQIAMGLRKIGAGSHAIYYFHSDDTLRVARILHRRRDALRDVTD